MTRPNDNLPPGSQPWKRSIEEDIRRLQVAQQRGDQLDGLSLSGLTQSLRKLGDQVQVLQQQQAELAAQQATLSAQQVQLTSVVNDLSDQVARIDALVNAQVTGDVGNNYVVTPVGSSWGQYAPVTIGVPPGYSRAQVVGISSVIGPTSDTYAIRTTIAGVSGTEFVVFGNNGSVSYARTLTGLSGGTITISTGVQNIIASGNNRGVSTSASIIFLR